MLAKAFGANSIALVSEQLDFQTAVQQATQLLVTDGRATDEYVEQVLRSLAELGPYFVIAPGIAIAHAAPSESVLEIGFALLHLGPGIESGSENDPVRLLFAFCSPDPQSHIDLLGELAQTLSTPGKTELLVNASAESEIRSLL